MYDIHIIEQFDKRSCRSSLKQGAETLLPLRPETILLAAIQAGDTRQQSQDTGGKCSSHRT